MAVKSTTLTYGLVSVPVGLQKVTAKKGKGLFKFCSPEGNPVKQMYRDEVTGEAFEPAALERGVEVGDTITVVGKDNVKAIEESGQLESLVIDRFIPLADVPFERVEGAYYIAPTKSAGLAQKKPLAILRDGLKADGKAGIGKLTLRTAQRAFVVYEKDGGLLVSTLAFADEFEKISAASAALEDVEQADDKTLALFSTLVASMDGEASDLDAYTDETFEAKAELVEKAVAGEKIEVPVAVEAPETEAVDLEALLIASVAEAQPAKKAKAKAA